MYVFGLQECNEMAAWSKAFSAHLSRGLPVVDLPGDCPAAHNWGTATAADGGGEAGEVKEGGVQTEADQQIAYKRHPKECMQCQHVTGGRNRGNANWCGACGQWVCLQCCFQAALVAPKGQRTKICNTCLPVSYDKEGVRSGYDEDEGAGLAASFGNPEWKPGTLVHSNQLIRGVTLSISSLAISSLRMVAI